MAATEKKKVYDLEGRCLRFAERVNAYVRVLPKDIPNVENGRQLVRAAGSVGANYIEANESLSKKDFCMRAKISRKEAKESKFWLTLSVPGTAMAQEQGALIQEADELTHIFGAIVTKTAKAAAL